MSSAAASLKPPSNDHSVMARLPVPKHVDVACTEPLGVAATCEDTEGVIDTGWLPAVSDVGHQRIDSGAANETVAVMPDGTPYPGDLIGDIVAYRDLRANMLSGSLSDADIERCNLLEDRLRGQKEVFIDGKPFIRSFNRFDYSFHARLRVGDGTPLIDVQVADISAGGVKIRIEDSLPMGERVWLVVSHKGASVVLPSRVAWAKQNALGLMFAGAPSWT